MEPQRRKTVRFRCKVAQEGREQKPEALINSGATHKFCYGLYLLRNCKKMKSEDVEGFAGRSSIIGHGEMEIILLRIKLIKSYHVIDFTMHILSVSSLNNLVDVLLSRSLKSFKVCCVLEPSTQNIIYETSVIDGSYIVCHFAIFKQ